MNDSNLKIEKIITLVKLAPAIIPFMSHNLHALRNIFFALFIHIFFFSWPLKNVTIFSHGIVHWKSIHTLVIAPLRLSERSLTTGRRCSGGREKITSTRACITYPTHYAVSVRVLVYGCAFVSEWICRCMCFVSCVCLSNMRVRIIIFIVNNTGIYVFTTPIAATAL